MTDTHRFGLVLGILMILWGTSDCWMKAVAP